MWPSVPGQSKVDLADWNALVNGRSDAVSLQLVFRENGNDCFPSLGEGGKSLSLPNIAFLKL